MNRTIAKRTKLAAAAALAASIAALATPAAASAHSYNGDWQNNTQSNHHSGDYQQANWNNSQHGGGSQYQHGGWSDNNQQYNNGHHEDNGGDGQNHTTQEDWENRLKLDAVLREHAAITVPALKAELLGEPDRDALMAAVNTNSTMVVEQLSMYATSADKNELHAEWQSHIGYYLDYLHGREAGDEQMMTDAKENLAMFTQEFSRQLAGDNSDYQTELQQSLTVHGDQVVAIIDAMAQADYPTVYQLAHEGYEHMGMMAELITRMDSEHTDSM